MKLDKPVWIAIILFGLAAAAAALLTLFGDKYPWSDSAGSLNRNGPSIPPAREDAYRANNVGVARLEQFEYKEAAEAFHRALQIDPELTIARVNLGIALYNDQNLIESAREAKAAAELMPNAPQPHYLLGLIARAQNRLDEALTEFQRVLEMDHRDVGANINLGQLYLQQGKLKEAPPFFRAALAAEPYQATAVYNLALALLRSGHRIEGQRMLQQFEALRQSGYGTTLGQNYLEQGRYAEAMV